MDQERNLLAEQLDDLTEDEFQSFLDQNDAEAPADAQPTRTTEDLKSEGVFDWLGLKGRVEKGAADEEAREQSALGVLGSWGTLDDKRRSEAIEEEEKAAKSSESFWTDVRDNLLAPLKTNKKLAFDIGDNRYSFDFGIQDFADRKVNEGVARAQRRQALAAQMKAGQIEGPKLSTTRNVAENFATGLLDQGVGGMIAGAGRGEQMIGQELFKSEYDVLRAYGGLHIFKGSVVRQMGDWVSAKAREMFPGDKARQEEFSAGLAQGAGSMAAFMGPSMAVHFLTKAGSATLAKVAGLSTSAGLGATMSGEGLAREAEEAQKQGKPVTDADVRKAFLWGLPLGATEALPIANLFDAPASAFFRNVLREAYQEGGQEFVQSIGQNMVAQAYYDPDRKWDDGAWESAAIGAILGGSIEASRVAAAKRAEKAQPRPVTEPAPKPKSVTQAILEAERAGQGPATPEVQEARVRTGRPDVEPVPAVTPPAPAPDDAREEEKPKATPRIIPEGGTALDSSERTVLDEVAKGIAPEIAGSLSEQLSTAGPAREALTRAAALYDRDGNTEEAVNVFRQDLGIEISPPETRADATPVPSGPSEAISAPQAPESESTVPGVDADGSTAEVPTVGTETAAEQAPQAAPVAPPVDIEALRTEVEGARRKAQLAAIAERAGLALPDDVLTGKMADIRSAILSAAASRNVTPSVTQEPGTPAQPVDTAEGEPTGRVTPPSERVTTPEPTLPKKLRDHILSGASLSRAHRAAISIDMGIGEAEMARHLETAVKTGWLRVDNRGIYRKGPKAIEQRVGKVAPKVARKPRRKAEDVSKAVNEALAEVGHMLPKGQSIQVFEDIADLPMQIAASAEKAIAAGGSIDAVAHDGTIYLAAYAMDMKGRLAHEGGHELVRRGALTKQQIKILAKRAGRIAGLFDRAVYAKAYEGRYDAARLSEALDEEAAMHLLEARVAGRDTGQTTNKILDKVIQFLERLRNKLLGLGYQSSEDIIGEFTSGRMALKAETVTLPGGVTVEGVPLFALSDTKRGPYIVAYHGSPHDFDRFDLFKIGTGEGAQAFGHGLYFAESEAVARSYRDALGGGTFDGDATGLARELIEWRLHANRHRMEEISANLSRYLGPELREEGQVLGLPKSIIDEALTALGSGAVKPKGRMYEVHINADPDSFLDWDKPLSQQSEAVRNAFTTALPDNEATQAWRTNGVLDNAKASSLLTAFSDGTNGAIARGETAAAARALREAGIPGIRYLDQMSRTAGEGSSNYVVFDPDIIEIVKKDGKPVKSGPMFALSNRRIDPLGFYSKLDDVLSSFKPTDKVTSQTLQQRGVKAAELEARGLKDVLGESKAIAVSELRDVAAGDPVEVRENQYQKAGEYDVLANQQFGRDYRDLPHEKQTAILAGLGIKEVKWSQYSLDPSNPTYRETVLHLPNREGSPYVMKDAGGSIVGRFPNRDAAFEAYRNANLGPGSGIEPVSQAWPDFRSGHWSEPNVIAHARTSMVRTADDQSVFHIDELQSDWGQKLRDGGVRDEAKITELTRRRKGLDDRIDAMRKSAVEDVHVKPFGGGYRDGFYQVQFKIDGEWHAKQTPVSSLELDGDMTGRRYVDDNHGVAFDLVAEARPEFAALVAERDLVGAELRTAEATTPGHPLVNTTDQWVNTALRRLIRQAIDADAEYIAIPSGDTISALGMGGEKEGLDYAYDQMYPKNLRNILQRLDPSIRSVKVDKLSSDKGKAIERSKGHTLFPLTEVAKARVLEEGLPLFGTEQAAAPSPVKDAVEESVRRSEPMFALSYLDHEANRLTKDVSAFEDGLWKQGRNAEEIATAIFDRYGFDIDPRDLAMGRVWWKVNGESDESVSGDLEYIDDIAKVGGATDGFRQAASMDVDAKPAQPQVPTGGTPFEGQRMAYVPLTAEEKNEALRLWKSGKGSSDIAEGLTTSLGRYIRISNVVGALEEKGVITDGNKDPRITWTPEADKLLEKASFVSKPIAARISEMSKVVGARVTANAMRLRRSRLGLSKAEDFDTKQPPSLKLRDGVWTVYDAGKELRLGVREDQKADAEALLKAYVDAKENGDPFIRPTLKAPKPPRLYKRGNVFVIKDRGREIATGAKLTEEGKAAEKLAEYIAKQEAEKPTLRPMRGTWHIVDKGRVLDTGVPEPNVERARAALEEFESSKASAQNRGSLSLRGPLFAIGSPIDPKEWLDEHTAARDTEGQGRETDRAGQGDGGQRPREGQGDPDGPGVSEDSGRVGGSYLWDVRGTIGKLAVRKPSARGLGRREVYYYSSKSQALPPTDLSDEAAAKFMRGTSHWVAKASVNEAPDGSWNLGFIRVRRGKRRRGIATRVLDSIERNLGAEVRPGQRLSKHEYYLWQKRDPKSVALYQKVGGTYYSPEHLEGLRLILDDIAANGATTKEKNAAKKDREAIYEALRNVIRASGSEPMFALGEGNGPRTATLDATPPAGGRLPAKGQGGTAGRAAGPASASARAEVGTRRPLGAIGEDGGRRGDGQVAFHTLDLERDGHRAVVVSGGETVSGEPTLTVLVFRAEKFPKFPETADRSVLKRFDKVSSEVAARVDLFQHEDTGLWEVSGLRVNQNERGAGLANEVYDRIEAELGIEMRPSAVLTKDGYKFWSKRNPEAVQYHRQYLNGWFSPKRLLRFKVDNDEAAQEAGTIEDLQQALDTNQRLNSILATVPEEAFQPEVADAMFALGGAQGAEQLFISGERGPKDVLEVADQMEKDGATPEAIWDATTEMLKGTPFRGAYRGADGEWRFEIDDSTMTLKDFPEGDARLGGRWFGRDREDIKKGTVGELVDHPALFAAYPHLKDIPLTLRRTWRGDGSVSFQPPIGKGSINITGSSTQEIRASLIHELQHRIQAKEGFAPGSSPWREKWPFMTAETAHYAYERVKGEVEARNVSLRYMNEPYKERWPANMEGQPNLPYPEDKPIHYGKRSKKAGQIKGYERNELGYKGQRPAEFAPFLTEDRRRDDQTDPSSLAVLLTKPSMWPALFFGTKYAGQYFGMWSIGKSPTADEAGAMVPPSRTATGTAAGEPAPIESLMGISRIVAMLGEAVGLPIRVGRIPTFPGARVNVSYAPSAVGRIRDVDNIHQASEAVALHLEQVMGEDLSKVKAVHSIELLTLAREIGGEDLGVGFGRFFDLYMTSYLGRYAYSKAPKFYEAFEAMMDAQAPQILADLQATQEAYANYSKADPSERLKTDIVRPEPDPGYRAEVADRARAAQIAALDPDGRGKKLGFVWATTKTLMSDFYLNFVSRNFAGHQVQRLALDLRERNTAMENATIPERIRARMEALELTEDQVADKARLDGEALSEVLAGRKPTKEEAARIGAALGRSRPWIFSGRDRISLPAGQDLWGYMKAAGNARAWVENVVMYGFQSRTPSLDGSLHRLGPGYIEVMASVMKSRPDDLVYDDAMLADFDAFLIARRAAETLYPRFRQGLIPHQPVRESEAAVRKVLADQLAKHPHFAEAAEKWDAFNKAWLDYAREWGLITDEMHEAFATDKAYAPFARDMSESDIAEARAQMSGGGNAARPLTFRLMGSDRNILSPTAVMMSRIQTIVQRVYQQGFGEILENLHDLAGPGIGLVIEKVPATDVRVQQVNALDSVRKVVKAAGLEMDDVQVLLDAMADTAGDPESLEINLITQRAIQAKPGETLIPYRKNGELHFMAIYGTKEHPNLAADIFSTFALAGHDGTNIWLDILRNFAQFRRATITTWPGFIWRNLIQDPIVHWGLFRFVKFPGETHVKGLRSWLAEDEFFKAYTSQTVGSGIMGGAMASEARRGLSEQSVRKLVGAPVGTWENVRHWWDKIGQFSEASETFGRLGLFKAAAERAMAHGMTPLEALQEAGATSTDVMNYNEFGHVMSIFRTASPFTGAGIVGTDKGARVATAFSQRGFAIKNYMEQWGAKGDRKAAWDSLADKEQEAIKDSGALILKSLFAYGTLDILLWALFHDDDDWRDQKDEMHDTHWVIPVNGALHLVNKDWDAPDFMKDDMIRIPKPFELAIPGNIVRMSLDAMARDQGGQKAAERISSSIRRSLTPPLSLPFLEESYSISSNRDPMTGRDLVPMNLRSKDPEDQYNQYTSFLGKEVGEALMVSPIAVDFGIKTLLGPWGRDLLTLTDRLDENKPALRFSQTPLGISRFVTSLGKGSRTMDDYYRTMNPPMQMNLNHMVRLLGGSVQAFDPAKSRYHDAVDKGRLDLAQSELADMTPEERVYALMNEHWKSGNEVAQKRLHPLIRFDEVKDVLAKSMRDVVENNLVQEQTATEKRARIKYKPAEMTAEQRRTVIRILTHVKVLEAYNALTLIGAEGYQSDPPHEIAPLYRELKAASPEAYKEVKRRLDKAKVLPFEVVEDAWPNVRRVMSDEKLQFDVSGSETPVVSHYLAGIHARALGQSMKLDAEDRKEQRELAN